MLYDAFFIRLLILKSLFMQNNNISSKCIKSFNGCQPFAVWVTDRDFVKATSIISDKEIIKSVLKKTIGDTNVGKHVD